MSPEQLKQVRETTLKRNTKYKKTETGKATEKKYKTSEKGIATRAAWREKLRTMIVDNTINSKTEVQRMRPDLIRDCLCEAWKKSTFSTDSSGDTIEMKVNVVPPNASDQDILDEICRQILDLEELTMGAFDFEYFILTGKLIKDSEVCESCHIVV